MVEKKVDGIKKMSKSELEKSRELVLDSIKSFEKDSQPKAPPKSSGGKKVDGIFSFRPKRKKKVKEQIPEKKKEIPKIQKEKKPAATVKMPVSTPQASPEITDEKLDRFAGLSRPDGLREDTQKKEKSTDIKLGQKEKSVFKKEVSQAIKKESAQDQDLGLTPALAESIKQEKEKEKLSKIKKAHKESKPDLADDFLVKEKRLEKEEDKKREEDKITKKEMKMNDKLMRKQEKEKKREEKKKKREEKEVEKKKKQEAKIKHKKEKQEKKKKRAANQKERINKFFSNFKAHIKAGFIESIKILFAAVIIFVLIYIVFALILLKFNIDNKYARIISDYFVVPAIITKDGIIEFYTFKDIEKYTLANIDKNDDEKVKFATVEMVVVSNLANKYGLYIPGGNIYDADFRSKIKENLALDSGINQVGINRIEKIKEMIAKEDDFVAISNKYGDLQDLLTITAQNEAQIEYSQEIKDLDIGEVSDIIFTPEGYYIFRCYDKNPNRIDLSYVFIKSKSLEEYILETVKAYSLWYLAK